MASLIPIQYHRTRYPDDIEPRILEVSGHFDIKRINVDIPYSLHTEYSFMRRKFDNKTVSKYNEICNANKKGIPMLWYSEKWAVEFADYIKDITYESIEPSIIEIHPPFSDYTNLEEFLNNYKVFKERITLFFPKTIILIENRNGTRYSGGNFAVSTIDQLVSLSNLIDEKGSDLRITLDLPQLFTAHSISKSKKDLMLKIFDDIKSIRHNIFGIHLWGKKNSENGRRVAHVGDLNSYFMYDMDFKKTFLENMFDTFNDGIDRYFVPEVNSGSEDLVSIVNDLRKVGFRFI